jgi:hypothetical protein
MVHEEDLAAGEQEVWERLEARFGPEVMSDARVERAISETLAEDRDAHVSARDGVASALAEAFRAPVSRRCVEAVLERERHRLLACGDSRVARARSALLDALRLPDEAFEPRVAVPPRVVRHRDGSEWIVA